MPTSEGATHTIAERDRPSRQLTSSETLGPCRGCGSGPVRVFLDLGAQPHCNRLLVPGDDLNAEPRYPLKVGFCEACTLVQIGHTIPKEEMFSDYPYVSGTTRTLTEHFRASAARLTETYRLGPASLVVDIGSNDGTWLAQYQGPQVLGVEAAENVAALARANRVPTLTRFFDASVSAEIVKNYGKASLVTAAGVFFHLEDLHSVIEGVNCLLSDDGVFVVQAIYLGGMVQNLAFDQIYHEHLVYYTLTSLQHLFAGHGLEIFDVQLLPIHGGSIEAHVAPIGRRPLTPSVGRLSDAERRQGLDRYETYTAFAEHVRRLGKNLRAVLEDYQAAGKSVWAYGAPAKGATLLNSFGIGRDLVAKAVEKSPHKIGKLMPGSHIPVVAESAERPDAYLMLAWNFLPEFLAKERAYLAAGGEFIVPVPEVRVIAGSEV